MSVSPRIGERRRGRTAGWRGNQKLARLPVELIGDVDRADIHAPVDLRERRWSRERRQVTLSPSQHSRRVAHEQAGGYARAAPGARAAADHLCVLVQEGHGLGDLVQAPRQELLPGIAGGRQSARAGKRGVPSLFSCQSGGCACARHGLAGTGVSARPGRKRISLFFSLRWFRHAPGLAAEFELLQHLENGSDRLGDDEKRRPAGMPALACSASDSLALE